MLVPAYRKWIAAIPLLVIFIALVPIIHFLLPDIHDLLTESYEPAKTLRFVSSMGNMQHKWGPFPSFVFAPAYAVVLLISKLGHHLTKLNAQYPFGFDNPAVQMGHMVLAGRLTVLTVGLLSIYYLCRSLQKALDDSLAPVLALLLCLTTSLTFLEPLSDTKPDGLMVSLLICALANFVTIILEGITPGTAIRFAFFYVASLSCKELTSTTLMLPYAGLAVFALWQWRKKPVEGKRFVRLLLLSMIFIPIFYLAFNVVYAPHAWIERMHYVFGPLKDPAAWAPPGQTRWMYLRDTSWAVQAALGWGGTLMLILAFFATLRRPSIPLLLLWLPFVSHLALTTVLGGYMPAYFMLPLGPALVLPGAFVLSRWLRSYSSVSAHRNRLIGITAILTLVCLYLAISATTLFRDTHTARLLERSMLEQVPAGATVNTVEIWSEQRVATTPGPDGRKVDHRPLYVFMQAPEQDRPEYVMISSDTEKWIAEIKALPARAALIKVDTNFDYSVFKSFEALGYSETGSTVPALPVWIFPELIAGSHVYTEESIHTYRLRSASDAPIPHNVVAARP